MITTKTCHFFLLSSQKDFTGIKQDRAIQQTGQEKWIRVSLPETPVQRIITLQVPETGRGQLPNKTEGGLFQGSPPSALKKTSDRSSGLGGNDDDSFRPYFHGNPKDALFDIDISLLYEQDDDETIILNDGEEPVLIPGEIYTAVELSFVSATGDDLSIILPGNLVSRMTGSPESQNPDFWKALIRECRYAECDGLFQTLALLSQSFTPRGDKDTGQEPEDMDGKGSTSSASSSRSGSGGTYVFRNKASSGRGGGSGGAMQQSPSDGSGGAGGTGTAADEQLKEKKMTQFMWLELAYHIGHRWTELAPLFNLTNIQIANIRAGNQGRTLGQYAAKDMLEDH